MAVCSSYSCDDRDWGLVMRRLMVGFLFGVVVAGGAVLSFGDQGVEHGVATAEPQSSLPLCRDLPGTEVETGPTGPGWNGCLTSNGAAVQSSRYQCSGLRRMVPSEGTEVHLADVANVALIPDAGLLGVDVDGQQWYGQEFSTAYHRTPFRMLAPHYRCRELRSLAHEGLAISRCDLDATPVNLFTTQGCETDGAYYPAVGRMCEYLDGDIMAQWEQWWMDGPVRDYGTGPLTIESRPDGLWALTPPNHRDERCETDPDAWDPSWRNGA